jgi:hypothetical protein
MTLYLYSPDEANSDSKTNVDRYFLCLRHISIHWTPVFVVNSLGTKYIFSQNRTTLGLVSIEGRDTVEKITFTVNSFFIPFVAFIIIIVCTIILIVKLRRRSKWLKASTTASDADVSIRSQKVTKMVVMISVLFIVCFVPLAFVMIAVAFEPNLNVGGRLVNTGKLLGHIVLFMESINSSANIFIYYHLSRKYRDVIHVIFYGNKTKTFK